MKKRNIVIHCLVLLMLFATFAACASTSKQEGAGEKIAGKVQEKLGQVKKVVGK